MNLIICKVYAFLFSLKSFFVISLTIFGNSLNTLSCVSRAVFQTFQLYKYVPTYYTSDWCWKGEKGIRYLPYPQRAYNFVPKNKRQVHFVIHDTRSTHLSMILIKSSTMVSGRSKKGSFSHPSLKFLLSIFSITFAKNLSSFEG